MIKHKYNAREYYRPTAEPNMCSIGFTGREVPARIKEFDGKPIKTFKKVYIKEGKGKYSTLTKAIIELLIPARATRYQPKNKKCRASSAHVIAIYEINKGRRNSLGMKTKRRIAYSIHNPRFKYEVGKKVKPSGPRFNKDHTQECEAGIHFFLTAKEAANY